MKFYNIEKSGIKNVIDEGQYEAYYKPQGWQITGIVGEPEMVTGTSPNDEIIIKNTAKMKRKRSESFDDGLIKEK